MASSSVLLWLALLGVGLAFRSSSTGGTPPPGDGTILPGGGTILPGGGTILPGGTPPPGGGAIPSPTPIITVIRTLPPLPPLPGGDQLPPELIELPPLPPLPPLLPPLPPELIELPPVPPPEPPGSGGMPPLPPLDIIGTLSVPDEIQSIQDELAGMLGIENLPSGELLTAIQSFTGDEQDAFVSLVADASGLTWEAAKAGLAQLGLIGGPLGVAMGLITLTNGNVAGVTGIVTGVGVTLTSLVVTGVGASLGMDAAALATMAAAGAGMSFVGGISALGPIFHFLFGRGGIFDTGKNLPTAEYYSFMAGNQGHAALVGAIQGATTLPTVLAILNTSWAPHGEVLLGADPVQFGRPATWTDPVKPEWTRTMAILRIPAFVGLGLGWVDTFIRTLWVQGPGETGAVPFNPDTTFLLQATMARVLPDVPAYRSIKTATLPGGDLYEANARRLRELEAANRVNDEGVIQYVLDYWAGRYGTMTTELGAPPTIEGIAGTTAWVVDHPERLPRIVAEITTRLGGTTAPSWSFDPLSGWGGGSAP